MLFRNVNVWVFASYRKHIILLTCSQPLERNSEGVITAVALHFNTTLMTSASFFEPPADINLQSNKL